MSNTFGRIPTVTVAVSALNEAENIAAFLRSVLAQREEGFRLVKIWVVSDGSTDGTVAIARAIGDYRIEVREHADRIGKSSRLNEIYAALDTDILVQSDADVVYDHPFVIRDIIAPLVADGRVGMCGGRPTPVAGTTFTERAVNDTFLAYDAFRGSMRGGNNVFSADGRILAYRRELAQRITVPADMIANDMYTYFCCLREGYAYRYAPTAVVRFRSPRTLRDQVRQNTRFTAAPLRMTRHFDPALVRRAYAVPRRLYWREVARQFVRHPIRCSYIFAVNRYCAWRGKRRERELTARWDIAYTTKHLRS